MKLQYCADREQVPKELWARLTDARSIQGIAPIPCEIQFVTFRPGSWVPTPWGEETSGVLVSSAWTEGCPAVYADPPFIQGRTLSLGKEYKNTVVAFYNENNNNGTEIQYLFDSPCFYSSLYSYVSIPLAPCYSTWQPEKMLYLKLEKRSEKTLHRVLFLVDIWRKYKNNFSSMGDFFDFMNEVDGENSYSYTYAPCADFLKKQGYEPLFETAGSR